MMNCYGNRFARILRGTRMRVPAAIALMVCLAGSGHAQSPPPVPATYQDLYTSLQSSIGNFQAAVNASWKGSPYPVNFCTEVLSANSALGPALLGPVHYAAVLNELNALKALGVNTVSVEVDFPVLYAPYYPNQATYQQYVSFYTQLASDVRAHGLKLLVQSTSVGAQNGTNLTNITSYYNSLSFTQYANGRAQNAVIAAQNMNPDYLSVMTEPDTEATMANKPQINTPSGAASLVSTVLTALRQANVSGPLVGAGAGTWLNSYQQFIQAFAAMPIQYVDMHIFPPNYDYLTSRPFQVVSLAQLYGKPTAISQTWLYKVRTSELPSINPSVVYARDPFSFWAPLDTAYLQALTQFAQSQKLLFVSPFWSTYFRAYLDYNTIPQSYTPGQVLAAENAADAQATMTGAYTSTGDAYATAVTRPPDTTPPTAPTGLTGLPASSTSVFLSWNPSTDNVGVAGYKIYRNSVLLVGTAALPMFTDTGLTSGMTYTYTVMAYDVQNNTSPGTTITAKPQTDNSPPSTPLNFMAQPLSGIQVYLTWSPAADNIGVAGYQIYRGGSPGNLAPDVFATGNSWVDGELSPNTTYYYQIVAVDAAGNTSLPSPMVSVTTLNFFRRN